MNFVVKRNPMKNRVLKTILKSTLFLSLCLLSLSSNGQCTLACNDNVLFSLDPGATAELRVSQVLEGRVDCPNPILSFTTTPFDTIIILDGDVPGPRTITVRELSEGNACWGTVSVVPTSCVGDTEKPTFTNPPPSIVNLACDEQIPPAPNVFAIDNCDSDVTIKLEETLINSTSCFNDEILIRKWTATDDNLNEISITQTFKIDVSDSYTIKIPEDTEGICGEKFDPIKLYIENGPGCEMLAISYSDTRISNEPNCGKILRKYKILDWCNVGNGSGGTWSFSGFDTDGDGKNNALDLIVDNTNNTISLSDGTILQDSLPSVYEYLQIIEIPECSEPVAVCRDINVSIFPNQNEIILAEDMNGGSFDDCSFDSLNLRITWADSSNQIDNPSNTFLSFDATFAGDHQVEIWAGDKDGNWNFCTANLNINIRPQTGHVISGYVFSDSENDCSFNPNQETRMEGWLVNVVAKPSEIVTTTTTDPNGYYYLSLPIDGDLEYEVSLIANLNYSQTCPANYKFTPDDPNTPQSFDLDIPVVLESDCPLLAVDISTPLLRRCFDGIYYVNYCNYGAVIATDAYVEVDLDDYLVFQNSDISFTNIQDNLYSFAIGDVPPGDCGRFAINVNVSCDAVLGVTHCSEAHIYPDSLCNTGTQWSGASLEVTGECDGDSIRFSIKNIGDQAMVASADYIIIEDVLMYRMSSLDPLQPNEVFPLDPMPATGSTWTVKADQEAFHPLANAPSLSIEGCVEMPGASFTTGVTPQFNQASGNGFSNIDCTQNRGSFDPNDKQGYPLGYGSNFQIEENTNLEYKIRFQNTGTDTAFTVRIEDKISEHLDLESIIPGASSHDYTFKINEDSTIFFLFKNIMLPDSNINEPASHGFVNFKISQKTDLPKGTVIPNTANIFFDFNAPVITNEVYHTIGLDIITVSVNDLAANLGLVVYPNPFRAQATFEIKDFDNEPWQLRIFDITGKTISTKKTSNSKLILNKEDLKTGIYFFEIITDSNERGGGKIIVE